jgi:hypothetical protein
LTTAVLAAEAMLRERRVGVHIGGANAPQTNTCLPVNSQLGAGREPGRDPGIRWMTVGCVALLALIADTVSYLHMHLLVEPHGQPGWVAPLTPLSVEGRSSLRPPRC